MDFIRGIAILMVIDAHSLPGYYLLSAPFVWLGFRNFGWIGVDIFFVLSGFLVGGLLIKEWKIFGRISAKRFLVRRGFKIWPQYYVFILLGLITGHRKLSKQWGNLLNLQNYMGGVPHTWSLAAEEHAYLLLIAILAVAARRRVRMLHLFWFLASLAGVVVVNRMVQTHFGIDTYSHTDTRIDGILYGVLLAILYHYVPERFAGLQKMWPVWITIITGTLFYLRFMPQSIWEPPIAIFLADLSGVSILLLLYRHRPAVHRSPPYRFIAAIGLYSYGIYLWHVSVIDMAIRLGERLPHPISTLWLTIAPYVLGILVGIFTTRIVEFPALALRDRLFPRRIDSAVGIPAEIEVATDAGGKREPLSSISR